MNKQRPWKIVPLAVAVLLIGAACAKRANPITNVNTAGTGSVAVSIEQSTFNPAVLTVSKGTTVIWTNRDQATHTVTGDQDGPNSGNIAPGGVTSYTFNTVGSFPYHCTIHTSMTGAVTVK